MPIELEHGKCTQNGTQQTYYNLRQQKSGILGVGECSLGASLRRSHRRSKMTGPCNNREDSSRPEAIPGRTAGTSLGCENS